jgi:hypothetical protein
LVCLFPNQRTLLEQLEEVDNGKEKNPPDVTFGLVIDIVGNSVSSLLEDLAKPLQINLPLLPFPFLPFSPEQLARLRKHFTAELQFFAAQINDLIKMVTATDATTRKDASKKLFSNPGFFRPGLQPLIGDGIGAVFSLATIGNALQVSSLPDSEQVPKEVEKALLDYFFKKEGYQTIDGSNIVSPVHLSDIVATVPASGTSGSGGLDQLKNLFSKATAEQYERDVIRVTVEAAYDTARGLRKSYKTTETDLQNLKKDPPQKDAIEKKFVNWFRGFSAMAESTAMRAVEVATLGVSEFQTNSLIAAAAGTFAGTVARKLAQDAFLKVLESDLENRKKVGG